MPETPQRSSENSIVLQNSKKKKYSCLKSLNSAFACSESLPCSSVQVKTGS